jgi:peptidoglycan/LPS O-acetylase OafA/YrhL
MHRIKRLDILRCVAVLLVLSAHARVPMITAQVGWIGVDLFFVLSGFLISGLLYSEYKKRQDIGLGRFFIRRGLKIYPAFYALILVTLLAQRIGWVGIPNAMSNWVREVLFVQNYGPGLWDHTWSLAVEEHFYVGLALLLLLLVRLAPRSADPFRKVPAIFVGVGIACLFLRGLTLWLNPNDHTRFPHPVYAMTHTRIDSLFFGVFIAYLYHFRSEVIRNFLRSARARFALLMTTVALLSTAYLAIYVGIFYLFVGFTFLYLGFGGLLLLCLETHDLLPGRATGVAKTVGSAFAYVGKHSYSIYLWHLPFMAFTPYILRKFVPFAFSKTALGIFFLVGACLFGILVSYIIEFPVLRLRDRFFPAAQTVAASESPAKIAANAKTASGDAV